jgi:hypothetical protein
MKKIFIILLIFVIHKSITAGGKSNSYSALISGNSKVVSITDSVTKEVLKDVTFSNKYVFVLKAEVHYPHILLLLNNVKTNTFFLESYLINDNNEVYKNSNQNINELFFDQLSEANIQEEFLKCNYEFGINGATFYIWDSQFGKIIFSFDYFYTENVDIGRGWNIHLNEGMNMNYLSPNRLIQGFQQNAVELIRTNNFWLLGKEFNSKVKSCNFAREVNYVDSLLVFCLGTCCVKNENLVVIYEKTQQSWTEPNNLGLKDTDQRLHYLAYFDSYKNRILTINYKCHENEQIIKKYYRKDDGIWNEIEA